MNKQREIKFRVWDGTEFLNSEDYITFLMNGRKKSKFFTLGIGNSLYDKKIVCQQFTGLKDKNGEEIYEGDIILTCGTCHVKEIIVFLNGKFTAQHPKIKHFCDDDWMNYIKYVKVIGNIFENPELLK